MSVPALKTCEGLLLARLRSVSCSSVRSGVPHLGLRHSGCCMMRITVQATCCYNTTFSNPMLHDAG